MMSSLNVAIADAGQHGDQWPDQNANAVPCKITPCKICWPAPRWQPAPRQPTAGGHPIVVCDTILPQTPPGPDRLKTTFWKGMKPDWMPAPGSSYSTEIIISNIQSNKHLKLSTLLADAVEMGCCLVITTESAIEGDGDFGDGRYAADTLRKNYGQVWNISVRGNAGSAGGKKQGFCIFTRGGWNISTLDQLHRGRALLLRGCDPGRNPISVIAVQCYSKHTADEKDKQVAMYDSITLAAGALPAQDAVCVGGDFNACLKPTHRTSGQSQPQDKLLNDHVLSLRQAGIQSFPESCNEFTRRHHFERMTGGEITTPMSKIDLSFVRNGCGLQATEWLSHRLSRKVEERVQNADESDHAYQILTYTATNHRKGRISQPKTTTRLFESSRLKEDDWTDKYNRLVQETLDQAPVISMAVFEYASLAALKALQGKSYCLRQRGKRRPPYFTGEVVRLKCQIATKAKDAHGLSTGTRASQQKRKALLLDVRRLKAQVKSAIAVVIKKQVDALHCKIHSKGISDPELHRLLKGENSGSTDPICEMVDLAHPESGPRTGPDLCEAVGSSNQTYYSDLRKPLTPSHDPQSGHAVFLNDAAFTDLPDRESFLYPAKKQEVLDFLQGRHDTAPGFDGTTNKLLLTMNDANWAHYMCAINRLFSTQDVEDAAVQAIVKLLLKDPSASKADRAKYTSYRPIALLPVPTKVATGIWQRRMDLHDATYTSVGQKGWQRGIACRDAQRVLSNVLCDAKIRDFKYGDGCRKVFVAFIDFRRAFDSVDWSRLEDTLVALKIPPEDRKLASNLLRNQSQQVMTAEGLSRAAFPCCGTAQGASESPRLFSWAIEPLLRRLQHHHTNDGYKLGHTTVTALAYADDIALVSSTAEGLQRQLDTVGDFCKWSGLSVNVGREKSATMDGNNCVNHQFTVQDKVGEPAQLLFRLNGSAYKYLGTMMLEKEGAFSEWLPEVENRLRKLKERHARLRLRYISVRQCSGIVSQYLSSVLRYPASLGCYPSDNKITDPGAFHNTVPSDALDEIVYQAAKQTLNYKLCADHKAFHLPQALHGLGIARAADVQTTEACCDALLHLNSSDSQVRETTRYMLHQLQARGFAGRRIGAGLGLLLKFIDSDSACTLLAKLGPEEDVFQRELPTAWLAANYPGRRGAHIPGLVDSGFDRLDVQWLCNHGILTVQQLQQWTRTQGPCRPLTCSVVHWPPGQAHPVLCFGRRRGDGMSPQAYYGQKLSACIDGSPLLAAAMTQLQNRNALCDGEPAVAQDPWPEVDGCAHPAVHVNVDGSQYTDPVCAGAGILVHGPDGKPSWLSPDTALLEHRVRVCGSQDNARAEMLAMYAGLRACRQVPQVKMHSDCSYVLDTMTKYWKDDGRPSLKPLPRTTNADLITVIVRELVRRDASHGPGHISLHKVESHVDDTPIEHVDVDIIAKEAATLPLPAQWQKLLPAQYTVMHLGQTHNIKELRALITERHRQRDAAGLPAHLQHLADPRLDHGLSKKIFNSSKKPFHESTLRATFGISMHHFHHHPGLGHKCERCSQFALQNDGTPIATADLHSVDAVKHMLFHCPATESHRDQLQLQCDRFTRKMRVTHTSGNIPHFYMADVAADALNDQPWYPDEFPVDPRGFFLIGASAQLHEAGLKPSDIAKLLSMCAPHVKDMLRLTAAKPPTHTYVTQPAPAPAGRCHRSGSVFDSFTVSV